MLESLIQELRFAARGLYRAKAFTAAAALTLALGITGTTVMFALIQGVLLRSLPVQDEDRLIIAWKEARGSWSAQYPFGDVAIESVADASRLLLKAAGVTRHGASRSVVTQGDVATYANVALVTGAFFEVLGVQPLLGRALTPADDKEKAAHVVISHGLWQRHYGASPQIVGRRITIGEQSFTIVGVMPPDLDYPSGVEMWRTTSSVPTTGPFGDAARREVNLVARLRPGVTLEQAASELALLSERLEADAPPDARRSLVPVVRPFRDVVVGEARMVLLALFAAVGLVLLIASANVSNLLLMRGESRRGELALRAALGAGRGRIVRQVLIESLMLALMGGIVAFALTRWNLQTLVALVPGGLPRVESIRIDPAVIGFSVAVVFATALLAGLAPALLSIRTDLVSQLRAGGFGAVSRSGIRGRRALVVAQVALALTVVAAAGLLIRTVLRLQAVDLGLPADRLVLVDLDIPQAAHAAREKHAHFLEDVVAQLEAAPAIEAATPVNISPFTGQGWDLPRYTAEGQSAAEAAANPSLHLESIHPNYFDTFEVPVVRGRVFTAIDRDGAMPVAIVSEDVAARTWPGEDPTGKRLKMGGLDSGEPWYTVVGVAATTRYRTLASPRPTLYLPAAQFQMTATMLVVRTTASAELVSSLVRARIRIVDPGVHVMRVAPFTEMLKPPMARPRFSAFLLTAFGVAALLLSTVGLYAVLSTHVRQRDREIAIRLALGATASRIRQLVIAETVRLAGMGAAIGLSGAAAVNPLLRGMLFEVDPVDPVTLTGAAVLLITAAALASYVPLRRAARVDAVAMLRRN